jgi:hypothetical protein
VIAIRWLAAKVALARSNGFHQSRRVLAELFSELADGELLESVDGAWPVCVKHLAQELFFHAQRQA